MVAIIMICLFSLGTSMLLLVTNYWWNEKFDMLQDNSKSLVTLAAEKNIFTNPSSKSLKDVGENLVLISKATQSDFFI
ncbi:MAG: hypothetical protein MJ177_06270 [Clostridia bacterium]|nr:hypothetical protein [Clostridia bacterium]